MLPKSFNEIPPSEVKLCLKVKNFLVNDLGIDLCDKKIVVAVSGGVDSMVLLSILNLLKQKLGFSIVVAHLNHGLREEAKKEFVFIKNLCDEEGIEFFGGSSDVKVFCKATKRGIEEGARIIRYRFLQGIKKKLSANYIAIAHHLNDLAEDVIMRLLRGVGWPTLGGMKPFEKERSILRPIIFVPKKRLIHFAKAVNLKWVEDLSNYELNVRRNRVRHNILPLFIKENPNFLKSIKNLWELARLDDEYFSSVLHALRKKEQRQGPYTTVLRSEFLPISKTIRLRWLKAIVEDLSKGSVLFSNLNNLDKGIVEFNGEKKIQFPKGVVVEIKRHKVIFTKGQS